jgi:hypothetical protein
MKIFCVKIVLDTDEQKKCTSHCASHVCYRQQIKLDCETNMIAMYRTRADSTGGVRIMELSINLPRSIGSF